MAECCLDPCRRTVKQPRQPFYIHISGHHEARQLKGIICRRVEHILDRAGRCIACRMHQTLDGSGCPATWISKAENPLAKVIFKHGLATRDLCVGDGSRNRIHLHMGVTVPTAFDTTSADLSQVAPGSHLARPFAVSLQPAACATDIGCGYVERSDTTVALERWKGVLVEVRVGVVEGQHYRPLRKFDVRVYSRLHQIRHCDRRVPIPAQIGKVLVEYLSRDGPALESRIGGGRDAVVHEDRNALIFHCSTSMTNSTTARQYCLGRHERLEQAGISSVGLDAHPPTE